MPSSGILRRVALVRTDVSEEPSASIIRVTRIAKLGTTLANVVPSSSETSDLTKPHGVTSQKTTFFSGRWMTEYQYESSDYNFIHKSLLLLYGQVCVELHLH
jgi:hypothetical protein